MSTNHRTRRPATGLALAAVLGLGSSFGLMAAPVSAEPGNGNGQATAPGQTGGQGAPEVTSGTTAPETAPAAPQGNNGNGNPGKSEGSNGNPGKSEGDGSEGNGSKGNGNPGKSEGNHDNGPKGNHGNGNHGASEGNGNGPQGNQGNGGSGGSGHGGGNAPGTGGGAPNDDAPETPAAGDPAGNNGTIKIAGPGDEAGHPSNNPHPGCTFLVEWYGFDAGDDVVSTVSFASQAPTADVVLGGTDPATVFVGGDAAGGGTDLDGRQAYTLTFTGEPHPQQGYHVKVTVSTPRSNGNDTKSKVFWVSGCETTTTVPPTTPEVPLTTPEVPQSTTQVPPTTTEVPPTTTVVPPTTGNTPTVLGQQATTESTTEEDEETVAAEQSPVADVLGEQAAAVTTMANTVLGTPGVRAAEVPTVINAGVAAAEAVKKMSAAQSALALLMLLLAAASARLAWLRRTGA